MAEKARSVLLVVDDESSVCRALRRLMGDRADEIITAQTPTDAETILHSRSVTHVICDHFLGPGQPKGMDIAKKWKDAFPSIRSVIILTGTNVKNLDPPETIDHVLPKTTDPVELAGLLGL